MNEKLSIVIPVYNKRSTVGRAIRSVLEQSVDEYIVYIVDDGSTDGSSEEILKFDDRRINFIQQENLGVSAARNRGVEAAGSGIVAFLDADDYWDPDLLKEMLRVRLKYPEAGLYAVGYRTHSPSGLCAEISIDPGARGNDQLVVDYIHRSYFGNFVHSSSVMIPCEVLAEVGGFPVGEKFGEDVLVWAKIGSRFPIAASSAVLGNFTLDGFAQAPRHASGINRHPLLDFLVDYAQSEETSMEQLSSVRRLIRHKYFQVIYYQIRFKNWDRLDEWINDPRYGCYNRMWRFVYVMPFRAQSIRLLCELIRLRKKLRLHLSEMGLFRCGVLCRSSVYLNHQKVQR